MIHYGSASVHSNDCSCKILLINLDTFLHVDPFHRPHNRTPKPEALWEDCYDVLVLRIWLTHWDRDKMAAISQTTLAPSRRVRKNIAGINIISKRAMNLKAIFKYFALITTTVFFLEALSKAFPAVIWIHTQTYVVSVLSTHILNCLHAVLHCRI